MRTVNLNLSRTNTGERKHYDPYKDTRAVGIARRDKGRLALRKNLPVKRKRHIDPATVEHMCEDLTIYPVGKREQPVMATVIRQDKMHDLIGIQSKIFNQWLARNKLPHAAFCILTGAKGYPPKCYLRDECVALVNALNSHYGEHFTFRDTDVGLMRSLQTGFKLARDRFNLEHSIT